MSESLRVYGLGRRPGWGTDCCQGILFSSSRLRERGHAPPSFPSNQPRTRAPPQAVTSSPRQEVGSEPAAFPGVQRLQRLQPLEKRSFSGPRCLPVSRVPPPAGEEVLKESEGLEGPGLRERKARPGNAWPAGRRRGLAGDSLGSGITSAWLGVCCGPESFPRLPRGPPGSWRLGLLCVPPAGSPSRLFKGGSLVEKTRRTADSLPRPDPEVTCHDLRVSERSACDTSQSPPG